MSAINMTVAEIPNLSQTAAEKVKPCVKITCKYLFSLEAPQLKCVNLLILRYVLKNIYFYIRLYYMQWRKKVFGHLIF